MKVNSISMRTDGEMKRLIVAYFVIELNDGRLTDEVPCLMSGRSLRHRQS